MKGLILINAYATDEEYLYQARRMQEELAALGVEADIRRNDGYDVWMRDGNVVHPYGGYDFCVYWDKDKYVLEMLSRVGMPLFNPADAILACDDKMTTYVRLSGEGVPMPRTLAGQLCYTAGATIPEAAIDRVENVLGYPLVAKYCYGSLGQGVYKVDDRAELVAKMQEMQYKPHLLQQYVSTSYGRDVRVIVVGGRVLGAMQRRSADDFRSNIGVDGVGEVYRVDAALEALAVKVAHLLDLDYCGIDFLFGEEGYVVCEVNSNAYFCAFERVTGLNVAGAYARHVCRKIYGHLPR